MTKCTLGLHEGWKAGAAATAAVIVIVTMTVTGPEVVPEAEAAKAAEKKTEAKEVTEMKGVTAEKAGAEPGDRKGEGLGTDATCAGTGQPGASPIIPHVPGTANPKEQRRQ